MSTFHSISLTPTSWMIIFIIVCVKMFFSWEAIVRGGWNTTLGVKTQGLNQSPERIQRSLLTSGQKLKAQAKSREEHLNFASPGSKVRQVAPSEAVEMPMKTCICTYMQDQPPQLSMNTQMRQKWFRWAEISERIWGVNFSRARNCCSLPASKRTKDHLRLPQRSSGKCLSFSPSRILVMYRIQKNCVTVLGWFLLRVLS